MNNEQCVFSHIILQFRNCSRVNLSCSVSQTSVLSCTEGREMWDLRSEIISDNFMTKIKCHWKNNVKSSSWDLSDRVQHWNHASKDMPCTGFCVWYGIWLLMLIVVRLYYVFAPKCSLHHCCHLVRGHVGPVDSNDVVSQLCFLFEVDDESEVSKDTNDEHNNQWWLCWCFCFCFHVPRVLHLSSCSWLSIQPTLLKQKIMSACHFQSRKLQQKCVLQGQKFMRNYPQIIPKLIRNHKQWWPICVWPPWVYRNTQRRLNSDFQPWAKVIWQTEYCPSTSENGLKSPT